MKLDDTRVTITKAINEIMRRPGKIIEVKAKKTIKVHITVEQQGDARPYLIVHACSECGRLNRTVRMDVNHKLTVEHAYIYELTNHIDPDHIFPVELTYSGKKYFLNKTKQGKLILTK